MTYNTFAVPDFLVEVNLTQPAGTFDLSYIQRAIFVCEAVEPITQTHGRAVEVVDPATGSVYIKDIASVADLAIYPEAAWVSSYFYKENIKTCDLVLVTNLADFVLFSEEIKGEINDRTFTAVVSADFDTIGVNTFDWFRGAVQHFTAVNAESTQKKITKLLVQPLVDLEEQKAEQAKFAGWFFNREDFWTPASPRLLDYQPTAFLGVKSEMDLARTNMLTFFGYYNLNAYCLNYQCGDVFDLELYYLEEIRRSVQQTLFVFLTSVKNFYTQENLDRITVLTLKTILRFSAPEYGFVSPTGTKVTPLVLAKIPAEDISNGIVRVQAFVRLNGVIRKIVVNVTNIGI